MNRKVTLLIVVIVVVTLLAVVVIYAPSIMETLLPVHRIPQH
jgi:hypothetical protein